MIWGVLTGLIVGACVGYLACAILSANGMVIKDGRKKKIGENDE